MLVLRESDDVHAQVSLGIKCKRRQKNPVVRRELRSLGISIPYRFPIQVGAVRSYFQFPKHLLVEVLPFKLSYVTS